MKLAYLLNSYPMTSTTFIRREMEAIEALGQPIARFAIRQWDTALVDPLDIAEQQHTDYILTGGKAALVKDTLIALVCDFGRVLALLPLWWRIWRNARGQFIQHAAYLVEALAFRTRARRAGIEHVHVHFSTNAATVALLAHRLGGPSYSFTVHGPDELIDPPALSLAIKVRDAAFVVAITDYCRGRILAEAPLAGARVKVVRCGIDLDDLPFDGEAPQTGRIICIGRLCHNKGQKHIPAALAKLGEEFPELLVELIGGGEDQALIEAEAHKYGVEHHIKLSGWGTGAQVKTGIRGARALLLPSYAEGLPIVIMEALAIGRPVLTTRITGIPELVDSGCGWIFEPGEVDAIAQALREVMEADAEDRAEMGHEGRRRVEELHDLQKSAKALLTAFQQQARSL